MTYETASATGPNDLLDKLRIFALADGWTVDYNGGRTNPGGALQAGSNNAIAIHKGSFYAVLYQDTSSNTVGDPTPRVACYTYPGPWVANNGSDAQANKINTSTANNLNGPYSAYHFFSNTARTYLHVAVEVTPGRFSHFHIGNLEKAGGGTDVSYAAGLSWAFNTSPLYTSDKDSTQHNIPFNDDGPATKAMGVRVDSDGIIPRNQILNSADSGQAKGGWRNGSSYSLAQDMAMNARASELTGRAPLLPLIVMSSRTAGVYSIVGTPSDLRFVDMTNLAPGEIVTLGSDQWKVFPVVRRNGVSGIENSGTYGFAYRLVT